MALLRSPFAVLVVTSVLVAGSPAIAQPVDLSFAPTNQSAFVGDFVEIQIVATSASGLDQPVVAIDSILSWDETKLLFDGIVGGPAPWFVSGFLTDPDGLNADLSDGDGLHTALASAGMPIEVPGAPGAVVTTLRFLALEPTPGTEISFLDTFGSFSQTQVLFLFAEDFTGDTSAIGTVVIDPPPPGFVRGDSNDDGTLDIADGIWTLSYLFQSGPASPCFDAADCNDDGTLDVADPIYGLNYLFISGPPPPLPFPTCGPDPTVDSLDCLFSAQCP